MNNEVKFLVSKLSNSSPSIRLSTLIKLKKIADISYLNSITKLFDDPNLMIRNVALNVAKYIINIQYLNSFYRTPKNAKQKLASMLRLYDKTLFDTLQEEINSEDSERKIKAIELLELMKEKSEVVPIIKKLAESENKYVRATAARALGKFGDYKYLKRMLKDPDERVRANAIEALSNANDPALTDLFFRYVYDKNNRIRANALYALWKLGHYEIFEIIKDMITDRAEKMKISGCWIISEIKNPKFLKYIVPLLSDVSNDIRLAALQSVLKVGGDEAHKIIAKIFRKKGDNTL